MFKLLNRFAWLIAIIIAISITAIDDDFFFYWIIFWLIVKFIFLSDSFIKSRLEFFATSIKENYLWNEKINNSPIIPFNKGDEDIKKEETINLAEIEQEKIETEEQEKHQALQEEIRQEKIADIQNNTNYTQKRYEQTAFDIFLINAWNYIKDFFSTNLLAKLGWILVFLAVVYFLKWVVWNFWEIIWPIGRITLGIIIGFTTYLVWVKIHSNYENEWLILMWTWVLINFAVILSWRYLIWDDWYLTEWTTFLFLILNTVFAALTSLVYKSKTLLLFSFIFAYLNPFIIWAETSWEPYTLIWYSLIVSLWALYISIRQVNMTLLLISFIAWNLLFLIAPFSDSIWWSSKIILTSLFSIASVISINKFKGLNHNTPKLITNLFIWAYVFIILNLLNSSIYFEGTYINVLSETFSFIVYNLIILSLFIFSINIVRNSPIIPFHKEDENNNSSFLSIILFLPLILLVWILFSWNLIFTPFILVATIITYLIWFTFIQNLSNIFSYIFFGALAVFILLFNLDIALMWNNSLISSTEFITIIFTSLIFLFSSYYYSIKPNLSNLFSIWTIWTILILSPIIKNNGEFMNYSILAISIFALANWVLPFINKNLLEKAKNLSNLITWSVLWALFLSFQIYSFWELYFPWISEGFAFLALAVIYFIQGYFIADKIWIEKIKKSNDLKNVFYSYTWISISLFSIAIAFVFSNHPEIISTTWLFEATVLYFFYWKTENTKIFWAATILFIVWLTKFGILIDVVQKWEYLFLISFLVIFWSFILNLKFLDKTKEKGLTIIHNSLHMLWMLIMWWLLLKIIESTWHGWSTLWISLFTWLLWTFYSRFSFDLLKKVFVLLIAIISIAHIWSIEYIFWNLGKDNLEYLKIVQYFVSAIIIWNLFIWNKLNTKKSYNKTLTIILGFYAFVISNFYILDIFESMFAHFSLTIYWGLIASALLIYWIQENIIKYRTIWLYFLTLTSAKIFLYDVWEIGNTNSRVLAFAILWVIFIIISTLYTKRYWDNLLWEFSLDNLKDIEKLPNKESKKEEKVENNSLWKKEINKKEVKETKFIINDEIKNIDVSNIKTVKFSFSNWKNISIRAVNLIKISKLIVRELDWKTKFEKWDLSDIYEYVKNNYKSELSKDNYDKIIVIIEKFVLLGWEVIFIEK